MTRLERVGQSVIGSLVHSAFSAQAQNALERRSSESFLVRRSGWCSLTPRSEPTPQWASESVPFRTLLGSLRH